MQPVEPLLSWKILFPGSTINIASILALPYDIEKVENLVEENWLNGLPANGPV